MFEFYGLRSALINFINYLSSSSFFLPFSSSERRTNKIVSSRIDNSREKRHEHCRMELKNSHLKGRTLRGPTNARGDNCRNSECPRSMVQSNGGKTMNYSGHGPRDSLKTGHYESREPIQFHFLRRKTPITPNRGCHPTRHAPEIQSHRPANSADCGSPAQNTQQRRRPYITSIARTVHPLPT